MKTPHFFLLALAAGVATDRLPAQEPPVRTPAVKKDVGISSRDGITISGADVMVTRNGTTEKLEKEMVLPNGFRVQLDGKIVIKDGDKITLRSSQLLTFDGRILEVPVVESVAPKVEVIVIPTAPAAVPTTPVAPTKPLPRQGHIRAGEGVQK